MGRCKSWRLVVISSYVIIGVFYSAITAEGSPDRRWSVRKTGEFGRRIDLSKELQLLTKQFRLHELNLELSESRRYDYEGGFGVRRPSLNLELPHFSSNSVSSSDQEAQETENDEGGYAYAKPDSVAPSGESENGGYVYTTPPTPFVKPNFDEPEYGTASPPLPNPVEPGVIAGADVTPLEGPLTRETSEDINSAGLRPSPNPSSPLVKGIESTKGSCTDDNDPNCWTHDYSDVIPGIAGQDYPILSEIVETNFQCDEQEYSGYYADFDQAARCQIFHICLKRSNYRKTQKWSFLCPNGTIFSQRELVCVLWPDAECDEATVRSLYNINQELGWDNITETLGNKMGARLNNGNSELQTAMSAFRAASSAAKFSNANPSTPARGSGLPYRVPVKGSDESGRARTKLQEVSKTPLHGAAYELEHGDNTEHEVEESSNFETSLRKESRTKSGSELHKSTSEAYELKGAPDGVQPFIVNRPRGNQVNNNAEYDDAGQTERPHQVVMMMSARQRMPDGSDGYAQVPVMLPQSAEAENEEGYNYPQPNGEPFTLPPPTYLPPHTSTTQQPYTTTTENFPPLVVPTEPPLDRENYENDYQNNADTPATEGNDDNGYYYPNPTSTDRTENDDYLSQNYNQQQNNRYQDQAAEQQQQNAEEPEEGYRYPQPTTTTETPAGNDEGYQYPQPKPTDAPEEEGYRYPAPTSTETPATEEGYNYPQPQEASTESPEDGYRYPSPTSATARSASRLRNTYPTTTEQAVTTTARNDIASEDDNGYQYPVPNDQLGYNPNDQYQVTDNEVSGGYNTESTTRFFSPKRNKELVEESTEEPISSTTINSQSTEIPAGGYLPPNRDPPDYSEPNSKPDTKHVTLDEDTVGIAAGGEEDYENEEVNQVVTGPTGTPEEDNESNSGYSYNYPTPPASEGQTSGAHLDSDEKVNEILKQIQNGGIEAVDGSGQPIPFDKLKELLLTSPPGSVELKGDIDSVTSATTDNPTSPQTEAPTTVFSSPPEPELTPVFHTVTTATVLPNNANPSENFYLSNTNANNNQNAQQQQQQNYFTNNNNVLVDHPTYEIKLPNREFESHSVLANTIDNSNQNSNQFQFNQQPQTVQNVNYVQSQPTPQQQFFPQSQNFHSSTPTLATSLVIPRESYLPPASRNPPVINNLVITPTHQTPSQYQQQQHTVTSVQQPHGQYLPPRQGSSSNLQQSQYYRGRDASSTFQTETRTLVAKPIQLTDNIQLQQSFAQPLPIAKGNNGNQNPLVNPKDIKIVPALFVHQHTSVASQIENELSGQRNSFQNLDTAQSNYYPPSGNSSPNRFGGDRNLLAEQLNQLANSVYTPSNAGVGRQFTRRSNAGKGSRSTSSSSSSAPTHTIEKATQVTTFTLEDARTPEELQKYHHEDLKRFHSENIAKLGGVLTDSQVSQRPSSEHSIPKVQHSFVTHQSNNRGTSNTNGQRNFQQNTNQAENQRNRNGRRGGDSSRSNKNAHNSSSSQGSNSDNGRSNNEDYFIPVSGSYGGGRGSGSSSSNSRNNNSSQFRVSNSGRSGNSGRSYFESAESEHTLLKRFLPENEGGFGARLL